MTVSAAGDPGSAAPHRFPVVVVGAGPADLTVGNILRAAGVDCLVLETGSRAAVERRPRAGVVEEWAVRGLERRGPARVLLGRARKHTECEFRFGGERHPVPVHGADRTPPLRLPAAVPGDGPGARVRRCARRRDPVRRPGRAPARPGHRPPLGVVPVPGLR
ncbi:FAD-dependent monooxygenase [Streptomyces sp. NPDC004783]|uniref:FAD-dependent monooxygenase n=1 Tax=Streptomyces sp. NPDC004783 TaxID=3154459 RepID=UPI00339E46BA